MSPAEWESLCDGCGKCCVLKLEDVDTNMIYSTDVGCKLLDCDNARCRHYAERKKYVPDCVVLTPDNLSQLSWMPKSCAYRRLY
ncbi:MAG: YcgN family cysteine cluster protein, partial [Proteobacteria bacterium]|nr:YcgN family cysteine cluster protein [Pseudomonadota bacterium]